MRAFVFMHSCFRLLDISSAYELYTSLKNPLKDALEDALKGLKLAFTPQHDSDELLHEETRKGDAGSSAFAVLKYVDDAGLGDKDDDLTSRNVGDSDEKFSRVPKQRSDKPLEDESEQAEHVFKHAFCRKVNVHFVGAW